MVVPARNQQNQRKRELHLPHTVNLSSARRQWLPGVVDSADVSQVPEVATATNRGGSSPAVNWGDPRLPNRFWDRVSPCPMTNCWHWTGNKNRGTPTLRPSVGSAKMSAKQLVHSALCGDRAPRKRLHTQCSGGDCVNPLHFTEQVTDAVRTARWVRLNIRRKRLSDRQYHLKKYGLTLEEFETRMASQGGRCPVCDDEFSGRGRGKKCPVVDHCHASNLTREIICGACNMALGLFGDRPAALRAAADYLVKHGKSESE